MDRLKAIFISHTHHDHVMDAPYIASRTGAVIYGSSSAMNAARGGDVPESQLVPFQANETYEIGSFRIKVIPSIHSKPTILNNDLGQTIDAPLRQPAGLRSYKEGGSFDFYVESEGRKYMIRPSFNYLEGQMDGYQADVLFLGVAGLQKAEAAMEEKFFAETVAKLNPDVVIPFHWDNFFSPLTKPVTGMPSFIEKTEVVFFKLANYCEAHDVSMAVQIPGTSIEL
ncbi:MAG: MBL fold metallo-hydrolase [Solobacterium sp.]|nr:MBL fold metallo-hydrolase [Solobacterium sp.]